MPDPTQLLENAAHLGAWVYAIVGVLAFLETAMVLGLLVPGELAVILGGGLAAAGAVDLVALTAVVWGAAVAGDTTSYAIGRRLGPHVRQSRVGRGTTVGLRLPHVNEQLPVHEGTVNGEGEQADGRG